MGMDRGLNRLAPKFCHGPRRRLKISHVHARARNFWRVLLLFLTSIILHIQLTYGPTKKPHTTHQQEPSVTVERKRQDLQVDM